MTKKSTWAIIAGAVWSFVFALMSFYWAMGGMAGVESLGGKIYQLALDRNPEFILLIWITGFIKVIGGVFLLLMLMNRIPVFLEKTLYWISIVAGIFLFLYGAANFTTVGMAKWGLLEMEQQSQFALNSRFYFWEPFWMIGGILYFLAGRWGRKEHFDRNKTNHIEREPSAKDCR